MREREIEIEREGESERKRDRKKETRFMVIIFLPLHTALISNFTNSLWRLFFSHLGFLLESKAFLFLISIINDLK